MFWFNTPNMQMMKFIYHITSPVNSLIMGSFVVFRDTLKGFRVTVSPLVLYYCFNTEFRIHDRVFKCYLFTEIHNVSKLFWVKRDEKIYFLN